MFVLIGKVVFLMIAIMYETGVIARLIRNQDVPFGLILFASFGIVGFITLQWLI